jgi:hypothetical protein
MKKLLTLGLLVLLLPACAQEFKATGNLETPPSDGFYKIYLSPAEAQYTATSFNNIRVLDSKNVEVPYIFTEEKPRYLQQQFKAYEILEKKQIARSHTVLKLHNPTQASIDNISLMIRNAEVLKTARLSGSDDGTTWFAVRDQFTLNSINNPIAVNELRAIEFPLTNYTYYLLEISDSTSTPINIIKAGYYDVEFTNGLYTALSDDSLSISTETKNKRTYITIKFNSPQLIDKLELSLTGSLFFQRSGVITTKEVKRVKKNDEQYDHYQDDFIVRSGQTTVVNFDGLKTNNLTFCVENGDNPALSVNALKAYQLNRYLIAWLKKGETYTVRFGGEDQASPTYDLEYFRDSIPVQVQVLKINNVQRAKITAAPESTTFFTSKKIIWIAIGAVIILLGFMSLKLVKETSHTDKDRNA